MVVPVYMLLGAGGHLVMQDFVPNHWVSRLDLHANDPILFQQDVEQLMADRPNIKGLKRLMCSQLLSLNAYPQAQQCFADIYEQDSLVMDLKQLGLAYLSSGSSIPRRYLSPMMEALKQTPKDLELLYMITRIHYDAQHWSNVKLLTQLLTQLMPADHPAMPRVIEMAFAAKNGLQV